MKRQLFNPTTIIILGLAIISVLNAQAQILSANGTGHSLYLCSDSVPRAWGIGSAGQLANGLTSSRTIPTTVPNIGGIVAVSAGANSSYFLKVDGTVWVSGWNGSGQLGIGSTTEQLVAVQIPTLSDIVAISGGGSHSLFLKSDGTVWSCGDNQSGQLGIGNTTSQNTPVQVTGLTDIIAIAAGGTQSIFLKNDGTVWECGLVNSSNVPVELSGMTDVVKITAGWSSNYYLKSDGTVWARGGGGFGELGDGETTGSSTPVQAIGLTDIVDFSASTIGSFCLFLKSDETVWMCGMNNAGQFGNGTNTGFDPNPTPFQNTTLSGIVAVAAGQYHSLFLKNDGTVWGSGGNAYGQLGNATFTNSTSAVQTSETCPPVTSGINELETIATVNVYPNPGNGVFHFDSSVDVSEVHIYNSLGCLIHTKKVYNTAFIIDLQQQSSGIYFYKLFSQEQVVQTGKIIIE